ncbi:MAG: hypothetical protein Q4A27_02560 [bacterium]|nr:hypothetical protein [bacterium]
MDFIRISKKHSLASTIAHIFLNISLVLVSWLSIYITKTPLIAIGLVIISKWRTFAVRPRYWTANVKSNLVDLIFSLGMVVLMFSTGVEYWLSQAFLVLFFIIWILIIKPRSSELMVKTQSLLAVFFGLTALFSISYAWPTELTVFLAFLIGYATFRHILSNKENQNLELLSLFWGMILAEMVWVLNFLLIGYTLAFNSIFAFIVPQASIIATVVSFLAFEAISISKNSEKSVRDLFVPTAFTVSICLLLIIFFSTIPRN